MLEDFPELARYMAQDAHIVHNPVFESAVMKIQLNRVGELSEAEQAEVKVFEARGQAPVRQVAQLDDCDYFKELQERIKLKRQRVTAYEDLSFLLGTSASVERLLISAKCVMTDRRNRLGTILFEAIMFLKTNRSFWDSRLVAEAVKRSHSADSENAL